MTSRVQKLHEMGLLSVPSWLPNSIQYETITGSVAYGCSNDTSDLDIYGICIPPRDLVFPHLQGEILGFGRQVERFAQWQQHGIKVKGEKTESYDLQIFNIVKYFKLCMENNPNMIDTLFTPQRCILHITRIGMIIRDNRRIFLHKGTYHKFRDYAYSQQKKMMGKEKANEKRAADIEQFGFDCKNAAHLIRLLFECEQILTEGDLDLEKNAAVLKTIRNGQWSVERIKEFFADREKYLDKLYVESSIPNSPNEVAIKRVLLECLEEYYGSLQGCVATPDDVVNTLREIENIATKLRIKLTNHA